MMRRLPLVLALLSSIGAAGGCAGGMHPKSAASAALGAPPALADGTGEASTTSPSTDPAESERSPALVIEGRVVVEADHVPGVVLELRKQVEAAGGRIVEESVTGSATSWLGSVRLRIPPTAVDGLVDWLGGRGEVTDKHIEARDVSKSLFDHEIALANQRQTLERLRSILDRDGLAMSDVLAIEKEMTRIRHEIERIEGERRWLVDRVQHATLDVTVRRRAGAVMSPRAKIYPGPRASVFVPLGEGDVLLGAGAAVHLGVPRASLELDVFDRDGDAGVLATVGGAFYSDFLGRGERRFLNPYVGLRAGYARIDRDAFAAAADVGVELFKSTHVLVDANVRTVGLFQKGGVEAALVIGAGAVVAF